MKRFFTPIVVAVLIMCNAAKGQLTSIPDPNFEQALIDLGYDAAPVNGSVPTANINGITNLDVSNKNINDLTGIQACANLLVLNARNNNLTSLDISLNISLVELLIDHNQLSSINITNNKNLKTFDCTANNITSLDVTQNSKLETLYCSDNLIGTLDVTKNPDLFQFSCGKNHLTSLDVTRNPLLVFLDCSTNQLTGIDVSKNRALQTLSCRFNVIPTLDVSQNTALINLTCDNNLLTFLDVSANINLSTLDCSMNQLSDLDVSKNIVLTILWCQHNQLTSLDLTKNTTLTFLECGYNQLISLNLKNNFNNLIWAMEARNNKPGLCIQTDNTIAAAANTFWHKDLTANYDNYCTPTITSFLPVAVCPGQSVTITGTNLNVATAVSFGGIPAQSFTILSASKIIAIPATGASGNVTVTTPSGIASLSGFSFNPSVAPAVTVQSLPLNSCPGTLITFTALPSNEGATPSYEWTVNNVATGSNSPVYSNASLQTGDIVKVKMTSSAVCAAPVAVTSGDTRIVLRPAVTPSVTISTPASTICAGTAVTFTASPNNGGTTPSYQWKVNGINTGTNAATFTTSSLANGDIITVQLTSSEICAAPLTVASNAIPISVSPALPVYVTIAGNAAACAGTAVTFTATGSNGGTSPAYQWQVNGVNTGTNSPVFTTTDLSTNDLVKVMMTSSPGCTTGSPAVSNTITMDISPAVMPAVSIHADNTTICAGSPVVFTATPSNGGASPQYQWMINGNTTGANSPTFTTNSLLHGDNINVIMNSNAACAINPATSGTITMLVNNPVRPQITINVLTPGPICYGTEVIIAATTVNQGSSPAYQWKVNGITSGNNSPVFASRNLAHGDIINCTLTSNAACISGTTIVSNDFAIAIDATQCPEGFYMPSAFSPNNDGKNDVIKPIVYGNVKEYQLTIFDRWGQKVFETKDLQKGWNGQLSGKNIGTGVYIWQCIFHIDGKAREIKKGTLTLVR